jgi:hypothetical protein
MQVAALGTVQVPFVPEDPEGTTHLEGLRQGGPIEGSLSHGASSAAAETHVPVASVGAGFLQRPLDIQFANPVIGAAPISPHVAPAPTKETLMHVPMVDPLVAGMQTRPISLSQLAMVLREESHGASTAWPAA